MSNRHNIRARVYIGRLPHRAQERDVTKFFKAYGRIVDIQLKNGYGFVEFDDARDADDAVYDMNGKELCGERVTIEHAKGPPRSVVERERYGRFGAGGGAGGGRFDDRRRENFDDRRRKRSRSRSRDRRRSKRSRSNSRSRSPRQRSRRDSPRKRSASPRKPTGKFFRIEIENLPSGTTRKELEAHFVGAGKVAACEVNEDGKGFVDYEDEASQTNAIETLSSIEFKESKLTLLKVTPVSGVAGGVSPKRAEKSPSRSHSRSVSRSRSRSRSAHSSPEKAKANGNGGAKRRSPTSSRSRSRSRSGSPRSRSASRSPSRSHSRSRSGSRGNVKAVEASPNGVAEGNGAHKMDEDDRSSSASDS